MGAKQGTKKAGIRARRRATKRQTWTRSNSRAAAMDEVILAMWGVNTANGVRLDPDKEWSADTPASVADVLAKYGFAPGGEFCPYLKIEN